MSDGDDLVALLAALASPHRLRILAALAAGRTYVSELARRLGMNRPLLYMHLQRLEAAGLVTGELVTAPDGSSVKYVEAVPFALALDLDAITRAAQTLTDKER
ncbi:ArsR/SmtB family transcription factor [Actinoplanes utahensis]|uniref:ArsR family transcriptional regulator n=1 Tax=Actinoplanes utahensis TaxID=1869 RepID=A0A0A6X620_ACTUT|nr:winged helix-turn-helix domain-containing protein [Actinoplanes utahensis]KHD75562.1 ArsR family transcriptional regulator [Actinoplanes utahensis]GIF32370.1 transcriptional regulator [Actinoplanes utahensis]